MRYVITCPAMRYVITCPAVPGAQPSVVGKANSLREARKLARAWWRPDLRGQDIRIECPDGRLVEYAGPAR